MRRYVQRRRAELGQTRRETFVPQVYDWGVEAQVDWYEAMAERAGERRKVYGFSMRSMASGGAFHVACQRGHRVRFTTTAALVSELIEARDEKKLLRFQKQIASYELLIVDELGFVPLSKTGAELLFEMLSQRYERGSTMVTSNLPFQEWTEVLGSERLTGALLDRLTHHVHILEMNGDSYRLKQSRRKQAPSAER